jgi:hypothetical protein
MPGASLYPRPPSRDTQVAAAILDGLVVDVPDLDDGGSDLPKMLPGPTGAKESSHRH